MYKIENLKMYDNKFSSACKKIFLYEGEYCTIKDIKLYEKRDNGELFIKVGKSYKDADGNWQDVCNVSFTQDQKKALQDICIALYKGETPVEKVDTINVDTMHKPLDTKPVDMNGDDIDWDSFVLESEG